MTTRAKISERIVLRRESLKLSQSEFARELGLSRGSIFNWESGRNKPDEDAMLAVAKVLKTSVSYLYGETDDPRPAPDWRNGSGPSNAQEAKLAEIAARVALVQLDLQALLYPKADTTAEPMELTPMSQDEIARTISHDANGKPIYFEPGAKAARKAKTNVPHKLPKL